MASFIRSICLRTFRPKVNKRPDLEPVGLEPLGAPALDFPPPYAADPRADRAERRDAGEGQGPEA